LENKTALENSIQEQRWKMALENDAGKLRWKKVLEKGDGNLHQNFSIWISIRREN
jgi:hypothetical protein